MNQDHADVRVEIARIKQELARLRDELHALKQERHEPVGPRIKQRMTELEAELHLYELEQQLTSDQIGGERIREHEGRVLQRLVRSSTHRAWCHSLSDPAEVSRTNTRLLTDSSSVAGSRVDVRREQTHQLIVAPPHVALPVGSDCCLWRASSFTILRQRGRASPLVSSAALANALAPTA